MTGPLIDRTSCVEHLRVESYKDEWLTRRLLFRCLEQLDLRQLNDMVAACNEISEVLDEHRRADVLKLRRERFGL